MSSSVDLSTILNSILDTAADNLRIAKFLFGWVSIPTTSPMMPYSTGC